MKKATTTTTTKKAVKRQKSSLLTAKSKANDKFKEDTFSLSGLIRYAKSGEGRETLNTYIEETEKRHEIKISANRLLVAKQIIALSKDKELVNKDGSPRTKWSYWHILNVVGRYAKAQKGIDWKGEDKPKAVKQVKRTKAKKAA